MASSSALWVLGVARFTSSASTTLANTGPLRNSNLLPPCADSSMTTVPMMSAGIRSGVNWMRENSSANDSASVRTSIVLPKPGTPSSSACDPASTQVMTPSITSRLPTITREISSRRVPTCFWKVWTSSRAWSTSVMGINQGGVGVLVARTDQLEVATHVETIARWNLVLLHHLLGHRLIVGKDLLVTLADEATLGGAVNHLGGGGALATIDAGGAHVLGLAVQLGRIAGQVRVVTAAVALAGLATWLAAGFGVGA